MEFMVMERQYYYRQFVGNLVERHFKEKIDLIKAAEAILPEVQIDMFFEIPKEKLSYGETVRSLIFRKLI
jgi:hypothetical protein